MSMKKEFHYCLYSPNLAHKTNPVSKSTPMNTSLSLNCMVFKFDVLQTATGLFLLVAHMITFSIPHFENKQTELWGF